MKYLHTMVRISNLEESLDFYCNKLGLKEVRRRESEKGKFTLIFLAAENSDEKTGLLELTYNWDPEEYTGGRNFGHLAYSVKNIYETCKKLMDNGAPYVTFFIPIPFPGSALYNIAINGDYLDKDFDTDKMNWKNPVMKNTTVSPEKLIEIRDKANETVNTKEHLIKRLVNSAGHRFAEQIN